MLLAEAHGKVCQAARDSEDYLTSAVFGHLRYLPPAVFWADLFAQAKGLPDQHGAEKRLSDLLQQAGISVSRYTTLRVHFWHNHHTLGEPDLLLHFSGGQPPLVILIEVKLWSPKGCTGERDQLIQYLKILADLPALRLGIPADCHRFLVYLTPRDSLAELLDSISRLGDSKGDAQLFRLQWQDVRMVARDTSYQAPEPAKTILGDVGAFLNRLGLEYFEGFKTIDNLPDINPEADGFYRGRQGTFQGFTEEPDYDLFEVLAGGWT